MSYLSPSQQQQLEQAQQRQQKVILATGVFDVLHHKHAEFLRKARAAGDFLIVGLESDVRVTAMKGPDRPINPAAKRQENLEKLGIADVVFVLPEQFAGPADHEALIAFIKPTALAVSSHTKHLEAKSQILQKYGGTVIVVLEHDPTISTTQMVAR